MSKEDAVGGVLNRTSAISRTYSLGDFKNIKVFDNIVNIPEDLALDPIAIESIQLHQLITIEIAYRNYLTLIKEIPYDMDSDEALQALDDMQKATINTLNERLNRR
jgi:hypothetical protein